MTDAWSPLLPDVDELARRYDRPLAVADLLCDRHVDGHDTAVLFDTADGTTEISFRELADRSRSLAGALSAHGVGHGTRVAVLLPRSPELVVTALAVWRLGAIYVPLFTAFGADAVSYRVSHSGAEAVVTDAENRSKLDTTAGQGPIVVCSGDGRPGDLDFSTAAESTLAVADSVYGPGEPFILLYTSGTTGRPKGVPVPARALGSFHAYMIYGLDLRPEDVFWNVSDPGWAYGLWYGVIGPLLLGHSLVIRAGAFDPGAALDTIERLRVTNLAGSPTFYRALRNHGIPPDFRRRTSLRVASSAGEPLGADLLDWSTHELGAAIHDHYGQSEIGMVIGYTHSTPPTQLLAGSMGPTLPGFSALVLDPNGRPAPDGTAGELALDTTASPLFWFPGYYNAPDKTAERYPHGPRYYVTGDTATVGADGVFASAVRADDVINSSGYRIGPGDVEEALLTHQAVAEVAVFGTPDPYRGELVTAAVVLRAGHQPSEHLIATLQTHVRERLGKYLYPRRILFLDVLPRTPSGKVKRTELRTLIADR